jgi:hypothetical protein
MFPRQTNSTDTGLGEALDAFSSDPAAAPEAMMTMIV